MSVFAGYARYYDRFYQGKNYAAECDFIEAAATRFSRCPETVLDLACGTGNHGLRLAQRGYAVTGVDRSAHMLAEYRAKAEAEGLQIPLFRQDLRRLRLESSFDLAICMFDAVGYLTENQDLCDFFTPLARQIQPGGLLLFDYWHAHPMLRAHEAVRVREFSLPDGSRIVRTSATTLYPERQTAEVCFHVQVFAGERLVDELTEVHPVRYFLPQEVAFVLEATGWRVLHTCPAFELDAPVTGDDWHLVAVATPG